MSSNAAAAAHPPALAKYELLEEIGHGGMATVYRARDPRLGRDVAVKVIHKHLRENTEVATRFVAEARAAAKLRHPGIVEVYDVSAADDDERFLVVELIRGTTLRKILQKHRDMPAEVGAAIVLTLCDALEHAHAAGIIHRDVKPENVLVELPSDRAPQPTPGPSKVTDVVIKLTDFGIAKVLDAQGVTSTGQVLGSPAHMAPEQIEGGEVDVRTDVFALGVLMYECLVGHLPFEGKNPAQVLRRVLDGIYPPADRERPSVGGRWSRVIASALARDAAERTPSPAALGEMILAELNAVGVTHPSAEIAAYFRDPAAYSAELTPRLVQRLVARGEAARKARDVPGAAADYNRALALAPNDLTILKRVASLTSSANRRILARRVGILAGASILLGFGAFFAARLFRSTEVKGSERSDPSPDAALASASPTSSSLASGPTASAEEPPRGSPSAEVSSPRPRLVMPQPSLPSTAPRKVRFSLIPNGATLVLNGQPVSWFGTIFTLQPGPQSISVSVPKSKCCEPEVGVRTVLPAPHTDPDDVQTIVIKLKMLPSSVTLVGAPAGAQFTCAAIGLSGFGGAPRSVTLPDAAWSGPCELKAPGPNGRSRSVTATIRAGESNTLAWPPGLE